MRFISLFSIIFLLGACANISLPTPKQDNQEATLPLEGLSSKNLDAGECGLFLWSISSPQVFTFYQKNNESKAHLLVKNQETIIRAPASIYILPQSLDFEFLYKNELEHSIVLKGQYGEVMEGGWRIPTARIQIENSDGWKEIIPVSGVFACR